MPFVVIHNESSKYKNIPTISYHCNHLNQLSREVILLKTLHLII